MTGNKPSFFEYKTDRSEWFPKISNPPRLYGELFGRKYKTKRRVTKRPVKKTPLLLEKSEQREKKPAQNSEGK